MEDYNSLNENFNDKLDAWIIDIKEKGCNTVIYSLSDINYKLRFDEMITTFNIPNVCFAMCSFDNETDIYFRERNIPSILLDKTKNNFKQLVCISKFLLTYILLQNNFNVFMSEADIFWKVDINKLFEGEKEMLISSHTYSDEVNIGFYKVISNENTIQFFKNLVSWIYDRKSGYKELVYGDRFLQKKFCGCADQKIFDCALRHCNDVKLRPVGYNFSKESLNKLQSVKLDWEYISCQILMHYPLTFPNNYKGIHIWSGYSTPENQIKYAQSLNWHYIN